MEEDKKELEQNPSEEIVVFEEAKDKVNEEVKEEERVNETEKESAKTKKRIIVSIIISIIFVIIFSTIFALMNINNDKIINGTYIEEIDISGLSREEAIEKVQNKIDSIIKKDIELEYQDYKTSIVPEQIEIKFDVENAIEKAIKIGKTNNILIDNYSILKTNILKTKIKLDIEYNKEILNDMIKSIDGELPGSLKNVSYEISKDKLIITKGKDGIIVQEDLLEENVLKNIINSLSDNDNIIEIPVEYKKADNIDIEQIYKDIYKEPKNAYIEEKPFKLHVEENGLDFNISIEKAKEIISKEQETYEIPLKITKPKIKTEDLGDKIFKQNLSKFTTIYDAGNTSRSTNIAIAARTINGKILLPGETFSYNGVLGNTTKEKGYQLGGAYVNGKVVPAYGGGICQVSSTLYNAVLYANLEIVERYNHSYSVSYVPAGRDATVSYGGKDFKFKNNRKYPVKIVANAKNGVVSVTLKGIKEEKEYEIILTSQVLSYTPFKTTYQDNSALKEGKEKVIQVGHNGMKSKAYKVVKYNGKTISKTLLSSDTYQPMNKIIERGTKKVNKNVNKKEDNKTENKVEQSQVTENED